MTNTIKIIDQRIKEIEKGCKTEVKVYTTYKWYSKKYNSFICGEKDFLCDTCRTGKRELNQLKSKI